jgi:hypothetical protein
MAAAWIKKDVTLTVRTEIITVTASRNRSEPS